MARSEETPARRALLEAFGGGAEAIGRLALILSSGHGLSAATVRDITAGLNRSAEVLDGLLKSLTKPE